MNEQQQSTAFQFADNRAGFQFTDNRPEASQMKEFHALANNSAGSAPLQMVTQLKSKAYDLEEDRQPEKLGKKMFLWKNITGNSKLIISAHGGREKENKGTVTVPKDMVFKSYGRHGDALLNPGLKLAEEASGSNAITYQAGEKVPNYTLTKFQGKHGGNSESYNQISDKMYKGVENEEDAFDTLTVRNRWWSGSIKLQDVVNKLNNMKPNPYTELHLNICRSVEGEELDDSDRDIRLQDIKKQGYEMI